MRYPLFCLLLILQLSGCKGKDEIPARVLTQARMQKVMWEIFQADYYTEQFVRTDTLRNARLENAQMQEQIFKRHGTTRIQYEKSYVFYSDRPDLMKILMDSLTAAGEHQRNLLMQKRYARPDSLGN